MARAGPKGEVTVPPLDLRRLPKSGGARAVAFCERFLTVPKGAGAKRRFKLRPWQRDIVHGLFDDPRPRHGLVAIPRGNGKSTLAAALGLFGLLADGVEGAQVLCVASDRNQAGIVHRTARRMVELDQRLADRVQVYKDRLYVPQTDSVLVPLPAEPGALQGWDPSLAIVDELHVVTDDVYEAMSAAAGKRARSLVLAISTASGDTDGVMWRLVEQGRASVDPAFFFREYAAPPGCELGDEGAWAAANPALGDFLHVDALRANVRTLREASFRRYRLGQWVHDVDTWLPAGAWDACADAQRVPAAGAEVVLGFDGSFNADTTALVAVSVDDAPHVEVVELWERPAGAPDGWQVPIIAVEDAIRAACSRWQVRLIVCDPFRWARTFQVLEGEGLPVEAFPQSPQRMTPATVRFYEAVTNGSLTHDGDPRLARHVGNCVVRVDSRGTRLSKQHKHSTRRIDLAVASVMAFARASELAGTRVLQVF
jgi:phage terminase large subunit-like protein